MFSAADSNGSPLPVEQVQVSSFEAGIASWQFQQMPGAWTVWLRSQSSSCPSLMSLSVLRSNHSGQANDCEHRISAELMHFYTGIDLKKNPHPHVWSQERTSQPDPELKCLFVAQLLREK